jgi:predicted nucleic acid-binding protein
MTPPPSIFIDTNILVYASLPESPWHGVAQTTLRRLEGEQRLCCISNQVLREYYTTLTRADAQGRLPDRHTVLANVRAMETRLTILSDTADVRKELLALADELPIGGRQIHDANLVATMLAYGIPELLTNNPGHFQRFTDRITVLSLGLPSDA